MLSKEEYIVLYEKYISGHCDEEEIKILEDYEDAFQLEDLPWDSQQMGDKQALRERLREQLLREAGSSKSNTLRIPLYVRYIAAASVLLAMFLYVELPYKSESDDTISQNDTLQKIIPGSNKAILLTDDGTSMSLSDMDVGGAVSIAGQTLAHKPVQGQLSYTAGANVSSLPAYHTVRTPRGGQYQINLSDGTSVWLNAASSIRFPVSFSATERVVEITGEVYFDVRKQSGKPFIVKTNGQRITVLGTRFNVSAYAEEPSIQTSLIEGHVVVDTDGKRYPLHPGECTLLDREAGNIRRSSFDPDDVLAWQQGFFRFQAEPIEGVMRKLARWYDVEVIYQGSMRDKFFSGTVSRFAQIEDVLDMLALTGTVKFKIEGRKIHVLS